jgi:hypothetical protein
MPAFISNREAVMSKYRRNCLIISLVCFAIAGLCLFALVDECVAADINKDVEYIKGSNGHYIKMKHDGSVHVYYAIYDVSFNYGSVKSRENTHTYDYIVTNRPKKADENGKITSEWLKWLATLEYKHLTEKGERLYLLSKSGLDSTSLTQKSGKYYVHVWKDDAKHDKYVNWCKKNNVELNH